MVKRKSDWFLVGALVMIAILFYSSSMTYHEQTSVPTLARLLKNEPFKDWLSQFSFHYAGSQQSVKAAGYFKFVEFFIRKGAHFGTYCLLAVFSYLGLRPRVIGSGLTFVFSWLATTGYAAFDEFHQMLTGDRTPLFQDVMLDSIGALTGIVIVCALLWIFKLKKRR
ncbi:VanZ family protein [Latilactobacillus graminis]|uniref:Integral membrane protein n=2 Tax=Latilactobacillus graminis TaxID=60519 RepID=A0AA89L3N4_9LACO|nr:VanZ family protein [Latilactobacillus graminis]KRM21210.1 integral membrane protein [Latilactobacillus graminis DSM 20719]QFP79336.1 VanZ family protein [Latilactobacillus graminis]